MHSKTLGRAAVAASLIMLLVPGIASASWWNGDYDGRYDSGYSGRRDSTTATTERRSAPDGERRDYRPAPGERAPAPCEQASPCDTPRRAPCEQASPCETPSAPSCDQASPCETPSAPPCEPASPCGEPPPPPPPPPPGFGPIYGCENSDLPDTRLLLHKTTSPPPGTLVRPGDEILVDLTWEPYDFAGPELHKVIDCVYVNGLLAPGLSGGERFTPNDGHFAWRYFVPLDVPPGSEICDQGFVAGPDGWDEYGRRGVSDFVCFPVDLPPPPPPPCCEAPPAPPCCEAPPAPPCCEATPVESTTTTTTTLPEQAPEPYALSVQFEQQEQPIEALPVAEPADVLPRTGTGPGTARLAAAALGLMALMRRRARRY